MHVLGGNISQIKSNATLGRVYALTVKARAGLLRLGVTFVLAHNWRLHNEVVMAGIRLNHALPISMNEKKQRSKL